MGTPLNPRTMLYLGGQRGVFGSETSDMTSKGLGEMFEGDSADMCAGQFPLVSMRGRAEGLACADPGARTPIGASGNFLVNSFYSSRSCKVIMILILNY